ncbi:transglycosylase SLT domain-containing protein [Pseudomonas sp. MAP12]|uniref:Transglycosylase SLT domain-containing protein n=1 Tax=Geopseudomonas aromaticivorans TaxID=2849492 RepID=A0ABS6MRC8_9GAMM|nr:transglycosylase SLT domain-containing protein [Pseudomonas aromaticivorans]MBV2131358.1 transglycosylase SLT domain-containing protein [Pseudomonas aromaticivorans]
MRVRPFALFVCLLAGFGLLAQPATASSLPQQRALYDEAKRALAKNDPAPYLRARQALRDYPLEPLLAYDELTLRLKTASNAEIEAFLTEHGDLPQIGWMKLRWLRWLAERDDWQTFIKHYSSALNFTELDCLFGEYQFRHGKAADGALTAERLWLVGKSQPNTCDRLFDLWQARGGLTEELRWKRAKLAAEARNYGLAASLVRTLGSLSPQGLLLLDVAQKPELLLQRQRFAATDRHTADVVGLGLRRLARQNPEQALGLLEEYSRRLPFSNEEKVAIAREIGLTLARRFDARALQVMTQYDPELRDDTVSEWRGRLLLRLGRWAEVNQLTRQMPGDLATTNRWRYWQARSLQLAQPNSQASQSLYQPVAGERDFYGFLAADRINAPYQLNNKPMALDPKVMQKVRNTAGIRRALEFHARGQIVDGRREWYHVSRLFSREELVAQARLGYEMEWYFPAIRAISQAQYWDDLDVRFPMAHQHTLTREARSRGLHSSWVFAITRQESGFMADARSGVGAMGLMQLMPATAKETARRYGIPLASPQQALNPNVNIQLGAAYLSQVYGQFGGNRILASAAYNAGPGRVRQWLSGSERMPFDIWIETIPYDETRQYVQNVLSYSVIYGEKLGAPQKLVEWHERELAPQQ